MKPGQGTGARCCTFLERRGQPLYPPLPTADNPYPRILSANATVETRVSSRVDAAEGGGWLSNSGGEARVSRAAEVVLCPVCLALCSSDMPIFGDACGGPVAVRRTKLNQEQQRFGVATLLCD